MTEQKLMNGDCLEEMKAIPDSSVDMILCDLPYGTTRNKWDTVIPFEPLWQQYTRIIKEHGAIVLFGQEPFSSHLRISNESQYRYDWTWVKNWPTGFLNAHRMPLKDSETISVFYKKLPTYNPQMRTGFKPYTVGTNRSSSNYGKITAGYVSKSDGKRYPTTTIKFNRDKRGLHPTQKPVALLEYLIKTYTNESELVLDNCMGSGSTGVACVNTNRNFIGIELDKEYFDIAEKRIMESKNNQQMSLISNAELANLASC